MQEHIPRLTLRLYKNLLFGWYARQFPPLVRPLWSQRLTPRKFGGKTLMLPQNVVMCAYQFEKLILPANSYRIALFYKTIMPSPRKRPRPINTELLQIDIGDLPQVTTAKTPRENLTVGVLKIGAEAKVFLELHP